MIFFSLLGYRENVSDRFGINFIALFFFFQVISDQQYEFPYKNMEALASQGILGLIIPKEFGGLGQSHVCAAMVVETIARYGCPSTAMVYSEYRAHERKTLRGSVVKSSKYVSVKFARFASPLRSSNRPYVNIIHLTWPCSNYILITKE